jgi:hypothetical protein
LLFIWLNNVGSGKVNAGLVGFLGYYGFSGQLITKELHITSVTTLYCNKRQSL